MDLAGINFNDYAVTYSIYSKMCNEFNISGYKFCENEINCSNFAKLSSFKQ